MNRGQQLNDHCQALFNAVAAAEIALVEAVHARLSHRSERKSALRQPLLALWSGRDDLKDLAATLPEFLDAPAKWTQATAAIRRSEPLYPTWG